MATKEQLRKYFFVTQTKNTRPVAVNDIGLTAMVIKDLYKKHQYELSTEEFHELR